MHYSVCNTTNCILVNDSCIACWLQTPHQTFQTKFQKIICVQGRTKITYIYREKQRKWEPNSIVEGWGLTPLIL